MWNCVGGRERKNPVSAIFEYFLTKGKQTPVSILNKMCEKLVNNIEPFVPVLETVFFFKPFFKMGAVVERHVFSKIQLKCAEIRGHVFIQR